MACPNHPDVAADLVTCAGCHRDFCSDCVVELQGQPFCATCKEERVRDLKSGTVGLDYAGAGRRFGGMIIDSIVMLPLTAYLIWAYRGQTSMFANYLPRILLPAVVWVVYEALMLASGGQTLGKKALDMKVLKPDGSELTPREAWTRGLSRQVMALTYVLGFIDGLLVFTEKRLTLHDRIAKTVVVNWRS